jgi:hypothetical protein
MVTNSDIETETTYDIEEDELDDDETVEDEGGGDEIHEDGEECTGEGIPFDLDGEVKRHLASVEFITDKIITDGFTIVDIVSVYLKRFSPSDPRYTDSHCRSIYKRFRRMVDTCDLETLNEHYERTIMTSEDIRY